MTASTRSISRRRPAGSGFEHRGRTPLPALDGALACYVHLPTGARHLHLDLPAEDCAFLMAFLTPAPDSSGLTHVLEHLVMCGSERYPCRRAFFSMLGRTLSTAMNALATEDCTACHFATRSLADYENLLSVYLDAAFFPRLDRLDFEQEGCRVEIEAAGEEGETPVRRGVVLSEMRGLMHDPEQQLRQALNRRLFPSGPYRFNAGGDPWRIPALDYEALRAYHRRHYHPGNAVFLSAGTLRPEWLHARLEALALARFPHHGASSAPPLPTSLEVPPLEAPSRPVVRYPTVSVTGVADRGRTDAGVALAWRLGDASDPVAVVRARLLACCLLEQGNAPLRRALEAPGSPAAALASNGVQVTRRRIVFQCGVHGCDPDLAGEIETRVLAAVADAARDGLDEAQVDGALARIERELRERHDPRHPFPLDLLTRILPAALYGGEPAAALDAPRALAALRAETRSRKDTAELVRRYLRDNPERVTVTAVPDPAAARRLDAEDRALLEREYGGPARRQARDRVIERARALRRRQRSRAGESSLPKIGLDAVGPPREPPELLMLPADPPARAAHEAAVGTEAGPLDEATGGPAAGVGRGSAEETTNRPPSRISHQGTKARAQPLLSDPRPQPGAGGNSGIGGAVSGPPVWLSRGPTGGLVYARLAIDVPDSSPGQLDDVGLLCEILPESGLGGLAPAETRARIARVCDRLAVTPWLLARAAPGSGAAGSVASGPNASDSGASGFGASGPNPSGSGVAGFGASGPNPSGSGVAGSVASGPNTSESGAAGFGASGPNPSGIAPPRMMVVLSARALAGDENALLEILAGAHLEARFDESAREVAARARVRRSRELVRNGHLHAERVAAARFDPSAAVAERWQGPGALAILARAAEGGDEAMPGGGSGPDMTARSLEERLHHLHRTLAAAPYQLQIVRDPGDRTAGGPDLPRSGRRTPESREAAPPGPAHTRPYPPLVAPEPRTTVRDGREQAVCPLPPRASGPRAPAACDGQEHGHSHGPESRAPTARTVVRRTSATGAWIVGGPVSYCARVYPAVTADHPDAGPLAVLAAFLGGDLLQRAVRERGGAYGAGARYCARTCTVRMFSYRDPRLAETLRDFERAIETLHRRPPDGHRLEEAILRTVREIDKPKAFRIAAFERYLDELQGQGAEGARALRASVLGAGPGQLREVAERYLRPEQGCAGVLAGAGREAELDRMEMPWRRI